MDLKANHKAFISHYIKLDFFNDSNLKADIQNRISDTTEVNFQNALKNIQGDNKETKGTTYSEVTLLAMAYFFERVFPTDTPIKDADYTINSVKGFFDACNKTPYTSIHEVDTTYHDLRDTALFQSCYLIVQCAWFFNSEHFGRHQHITYVNHYAETRKKLPESEYKHDLSYLNKKYTQVDDSNIKGVYGFAMVDQWYYFILFLLVNELKLPTNNFKITETRNRIYNPLVKCSRMLRPLAPFKIIECDIKSAFPSFIDFKIKGNKGQNVYSNIQENYNTTRSEAKILFNKWCNSGKYKSIAETKTFLLSCGYSSEDCDIITSITHCKDFAFIDVMCEYEDKYINQFLKVNYHLIGARLHDAILYIDKKENPIKLNYDVKCVFGVKELNKPIYTNTFGYSNKPMRYAYVSSIPPTSNDAYKYITRKQEFKKSKPIGEVDGFRFYPEKFEYISASFDLNYKYTFKDFFNNCIEMVNTLCYLNPEPISEKQLLIILNHMRANSNIIFNVRSVFEALLSELNQIKDISIKARDFDITEHQTFRRKIDFLNALNKAKGKVYEMSRLKDFSQLLENRINKEDYSFIDYKVSGKSKNNQLLKSIILIINTLITGKVRNTYAQKVNSYPLYSIIYKEGSSYLFEHHKKSNKIRLVQRKIQVYEQELLRINRLINNRKIAQQYLHILNEVTQTEFNTSIKRDDKVIQAEKAKLINRMTSKEYKSLKQAEKMFNKLYLPIRETKIKENTPTLNDFNTSLEHSIFNNITTEDAYYKGSVFFSEYEKFHNIKELKEQKKKPPPAPATKPNTQTEIRF